MCADCCFLAALGAYALTLVQSFYQLDHLPTWPEAKNLIWNTVTAFPSVLRDWLISKPYDFIIEDHPKLSAAIISLVIVSTVLAVLLFRANRIPNNQSEAAKVGRMTTTPLLPRAVEPSGSVPAREASGRRSSWKSLSEEILSPENKFVYILGANGIDTFGKPGSPLYDTLQNFRGTVRAILCKPGTKKLSSRAAAVGIHSNDYEKAIRESVKRLRSLRKQAHSIEARYYDGQPNWKLIVTNSTLRVQYYLLLGGPHVDQTRLYP